MNLKLENLTENYSKQICNWKYENNYSVYNFPEWDVIVLEVRSFNERAIKCYEKAGFRIVDTYNKDTLVGYDEFNKMEFSF